MNLYSLSPHHCPPDSGLYGTGPSKAQHMEVCHTASLSPYQAWLPRSSQHLGSRISVTCTKSLSSRGTEHVRVHKMKMRAKPKSFHCHGHNQGTFPSGNTGYRKGKPRARPHSLEDPASVYLPWIHLKQVVTFQVLYWMHLGFSFWSDRMNLKLIDVCGWEMGLVNLKYLLSKYNF
jgi:hypothetical protein